MVTTSSPSNSSSGALLPYRLSGDGGPGFKRGSGYNRRPMIANPPAHWRPDSWQARPTVQQPLYPDRAALAEALERLRHLPPLVTSWEVNALKSHLAEAQAGRCFVLQGGDCAESFD